MFSVLFSLRFGMLFAVYGRTEKERLRLMSKPSSRKIGRTRRSVRGYVAHRGIPIPCESALEHAFAARLTIAPGVDDVVSQPFVIRFRSSDGRQRRYTPDFKVAYSGAGGHKAVFIYELKYRDDLKKKWSEYRVKFKAALSWCRKNKYSFRIITEREVFGQQLLNARALRMYQYITVDSGLREVIANYVAQSTAGASIREIAEAIAVSPKQQPEIEPTILHMIARSEIKTDLRCALSPNSIVFPTDPELTPWQIVSRHSR